MIKNFPFEEISKSNHLKKNIYKIKNQGESILFYKGDFIMDGKMFLPFTENYETSTELFGNFNSQKYIKYFNSIKDNFESIKTIKNAYVVGSNSNLNYYHNVIDFYSRLFFCKKFIFKKIIFGKLNYKTILKHMLDVLKIENDILHVDEKFKRYEDSIFVINKYTNVTNLYYKYFSKKTLPHKLVYVSRSDATNRNVINEDEVIKLVKKYNFEIVILSQLSFQSQINIFNESSMIITMHGAGLTNLVFSQQGQNVIEFVPNFTNNKDNFYCDLSINDHDDSVRTHFKAISKLRKLNHYFLFCDYSQNKKAEDKNPFTLTDIRVDLNLLNQLILKIIEI